MGSRSCAGKEKRTVAISATPTNFFRIPINKRIFEFSSGGFSVSLESPAIDMLECEDGTLGITDD